VQKEFKSFDEYLWSLVEGKTIHRTTSALVASTPLSDQLSKDLKLRGFKFVGSTICYSFMQAVGLVNDHDRKCFRYTALIEATRSAVA
jgi:DNA-3-methyladenine glycosylase I